VMRCLVKEFGADVSKALQSGFSPLLISARRVTRCDALAAVRR
jgi:hypothetical protein